MPRIAPGLPEHSSSSLRGRSRLVALEDDEGDLLAFLAGEFLRAVDVRRDRDANLQLAVLDHVDPLARLALVLALFRDEVEFGRLLGSVDLECVGLIPVG